MENSMELRYARIGEIIQSIEKLNERIATHLTTTKNTSMIRQYQFKRGELILELQDLLKPTHLIVGMATA